MRGIIFAVVLTASFTLSDQTISAERAIEEVVVTAQKREQGLQDVPLSVSVVSGETIEDLGMFRFEDLATTVPNLHIDEGLASPAIHMRGLGSGAANFAFEQSVGMFVDGVYLGRSQLFENPLFDVAQVEVVRGPQGALFGKNTNAGAVSITTRRPSDEIELSIGGGYEIEHDGHSLEAVASGPLGDHAGARLALRRYRDGGYLKNHVTGNEEPDEEGWIARGTLVYDVTDSIEATVKVEASESDVDGGWFQLFEAGSAPLAGVWLQADPFAETDLDTDISSDTGLDPQFSESDTTLIAANVNWDVGEFLVTSITSRAELDFLKNVEFTGTSLGIAQSNIGEEFEQFSQEFRLTSPSGRRLEYLVGALYLEHDLRTLQSTDISSFGPFSGSSIREYEQDGQSWSVYGSATVNVSPALRVTGSLRYGEDEKDGHANHSATGLVLPTWIPYSLEGNRSEDHVNGSANVQWDATESMMLYATYATGVKAGGFLSNDSTLQFRINQGTDDFEYEDEEAESIEIGLKHSFFDARAALNLALFQTDFEDLQVSAFNGSFFVTGNAAKARVEGVEAELNVVLSDELDLALSGAYLDARYQDYPGGQCLSGATEADGCDPVTQTQNLAGERLHRAPKWEASAVLDWMRVLPNGLSTGIQVGVSYKSRFYHQPDLDPLDAQDGYYKINARLSLGASNGRWEVALIGRNLNDELTKNWSFDTPFFGGGAHTASIAPPRTVMLEAAFSM